MNALVASRLTTISACYRSTAAVTCIKKKVMRAGMRQKRFVNAFGLAV